MATSGTVKTNTTYDSYFWVKWSQKSQSISTNKTTISWSCGVYCGHNFYSNAIKISAITIAGKKVYSGGTFSNYDSGDHTISSGVLTLSHNSDGTRSFTVGSFTGWLYSSYNYSSSGQTYTLTPIPRRASITSAPNFNDNSNPVLRYSNPLGSGVYSLQACIDVPNNGIWEAAYRDISKTDTSYTFNLTDDERTALRKCATGNPPQVNVKFYLKTQLTSTDDAVAVSAERTFTVQDTAVMKPSDLITIMPVQESSLPQEFADTYIQGRTKVKVEHTAVGKYDASIKAYSATVGGKAYSGKSFITDYINTAGSIAVKGSVTDSRGFKSAETAANSQSITVQPYSQPYVTPVAGNPNIVCARCDENGELSSSGTKLKVMCAVKYSSVSGLNTRTLQLRYKKDTAGAAFSSWITLINKDNTSDVYEGVVPGIELEASSVYKIQIEATDSVSQANEITPIEFSIPTDVVPLHLGKNGAGVGIGRYSAGADRLDVAWDAFFEKGVTTHGEVEIYGATPHIDFHFAENDVDYTSRIIETASGQLNLSAANGVQINGKKTENEAVTLTADSSRITNVAYTAKYNELLGAVFVRIYGKINVAMSAGYGYTLFSIDSHLPNAGAALSVKIGSDDNAEITKKAAAYATSSGGINIQPLDSDLNGYDVYITGFWFV